MISAESHVLSSSIPGTRVHGLGIPISGESSVGFSEVVLYRMLYTMTSTGEDQVKMGIRTERTERGI